MELWRDVSGYEGYYEVSNYGRVRSKERRIERKDGVIQTHYAKEKIQTRTRDGYMTVKLSKDGVDRRFPVHVLVAKEFVDGYNDGLEVNHKNYNRSDNHSNNLEWVTHEENIQYTITGGRHVSQVMDFRGSNNPNYENHSLHLKYQKDQILSRQKQGRPGAKNGRARPVTMIDKNGKRIYFEYIGACAKFIITSGMSSATNIDSVSANISRAASSGSYYLHCRFYLI